MVVLPPCDKGGFWRVMGWDFVVSATSQISWLSGGRTIRGAQSFLSSMGIVVYPPPPYWILDADPGRDLACNASLNTTVGGAMMYTRVDP